MKTSKAFSYSEFSKIACRDESDFSDFGTVVKMGNGYGDTYTFKDNGSDVLGVAHLDTVQNATWSTILKVKGESVLVCPVLDDRLGVYIITRLLPSLGVTCDWLLTTGEEVGQSSASKFVAEKKYNWAFSFDRRGTGCVLYQHDTKAMRRIMRKNKFTVYQGSFSDISDLDVGCSGINFGCGYQDEHSVHSYAVLSDLFSQVSLFRKFWARYALVRLPYNRHGRYVRHGRSVYTYPYTSASYPSIKYGERFPDYEPETYHCRACGQYVPMTDTLWCTPLNERVCSDCGIEAYQSSGHMDSYGKYLLQ